MDKIIAAYDWAATFRQVEHQLIHQSDHYQEINSILAEPGLAKARFSLITTPNLEVRQLQMDIQEQLIISNADGGEGVESMFMIQGGIASHFESHQQSVRFDTGRHGFQYNPMTRGEHTFLAGELEVIQVSYQLDYFQNLIQSADSTPLDKVAQRMEQKIPLLLASNQQVLQPRMADIIQAIRRCSFHGFTRYLFIEAKFLELFTLQLDHLITISQSGSKDSYSLADQEKLKAVRQFIEHNYLSPLTLTQLAREFGLNDYKLKKGYRQLFNSTVFGHIHHLRMQKAFELLTQKQMNVSETALFIGYNNVSSFSAEFRKRFGYSPGRV